MPSTPALPRRAVIALIALILVDRPAPVPGAPMPEAGATGAAKQATPLPLQPADKRVQELLLPGKPDEVYTLQRAGQNMRLLMVAVRRRMYFYLYDRGKYRLKHRLNVPSGAALFDVGDADGDGNEDVVFFDGKTLRIYHQSPQGLQFDKRSTIKTTGSLLPAGNHSLNRFPLFYRPAGGAQPALVFVPGQSAYILYTMHPMHPEAESNTKPPLKQMSYRLEKRSAVRLKHKAYITDRFWKNSDVRNDFYMAKVIIPKPYFEDITGDGRRDLFFYFDRFVYLYTFSDDKFLFTKSFRLPVSFSGSYGHHMDLVDFDQNGSFDLLVTVIRGSGVDIRAENYVYPGNGKGGFEKKSVHFTEQGGFFYPLAAGPNTRPVLLSPKIDVGIAFVWSYLIQNRLRIRINQYAVRAGRFDELTSTVLAYEVAGSLLPGFAHGDFTGNGIVEFAVGIGPNKLQMYAYSQEDQAYNDSPAQELACKAYGIFSVMNLNGNSKSDLVIRYPQADAEYGYKTNMLSILLF